MRRFLMSVIALSVSCSQATSKTASSALVTTSSADILSFYKDSKLNSVTPEVANRSTASLYSQMLNTETDADFQIDGTSLPGFHSFHSFLVRHEAVFVAFSKLYPTVGELLDAKSSNAVNATPTLASIKNTVSSLGTFFNDKTELGLAGYIAPAVQQANAKAACLYPSSKGVPIAGSVNGVPITFDTEDLTNFMGFEQRAKDNGHGYGTSDEPGSAFQSYLNRKYAANVVRGVYGPKPNDKAGESQFAATATTSQWLAWFDRACEKTYGTANWPSTDPNAEL